MFHRLEQKIEHAVRRTAFGLAASVCMAIGLAFLTVAAWIWLVAIAGALEAALIIGAIYMGVGFILLALAARRPPQRRYVAPDVPPMPDLASAFAQGLGRGMSLRNQYEKARR